MTCGSERWLRSCLERTTPVRGVTGVVVVSAPGGSSRTHSTVTGGCDRRGAAAGCRQPTSRQENQSLGQGTRTRKRVAWTKHAPRQGMPSRATHAGKATDAPQFMGGGD